MMTCDAWEKSLDTYLDNELSPEETASLDAHLRTCASCAAEAVARMQWKRAISAAGARYTPSAEFRQKIQKNISPPRRFRFFEQQWILAGATGAVFMIAAFVATHRIAVSARNQVLSEVADLHVATLASSSPVDIISTDRHTVKPWFQGRIPFSFDLPELQNTRFTLLGGRMAYLGQAPGAQLIYDTGKHHISVFIFPQAALQGSLGGQSISPHPLPFRLETWAQGNLRYFVIGDANPADIEALAHLFQEE